jgi:cell division protein FtsB
MSFLTNMYGRKVPALEKESQKNPNRVTGGLKGQGADHFSMLGEDGVERQIPTQRYVQSLEEQLRKQRATTDVLERKLGRLQTTVDALQQSLRRPNN